MQLIGRSLLKRHVLVSVSRRLCMRMMSFASRRMASLLLALPLWLSLFIPPLGVAANAPAAADPLAATGQWGSVIDWQIFGKHMALLPNGKVLAWPTGQDAFL